MGWKLQLDSLKARSMHDCAHAPVLWKHCLDTVLQSKSLVIQMGWNCCSLNKNEQGTTGLVQVSTDSRVA